MIEVLKSVLDLGVQSVIYNTCIPSSRREGSERTATEQGKRFALLLQKNRKNIYIITGFNI